MRSNKCQVSFWNLNILKGLKRIATAIKNIRIPKNIKIPKNIRISKKSAQRKIKDTLIPLINSEDNNTKILEKNIIKNNIKNVLKQKY